MKLCHYVSATALQSNASISMCNELTNDTQSTRNKHFIMSIMQFVSVIKSCTYWDSSTLQALHEHACLSHEKCNVDRVGKIPSNITVSDCELCQYQLPQKRGEGCERLTIFMQSCVPLGPGKFDVVVLVKARNRNQYPASRVSFDLPRQIGKRKETASRFF